MIGQVLGVVDNQGENLVTVVNGQGDDVATIGSQVGGEL